MALTTDVYWDINGIPLQTMAYNISTWGGDLQAPPPLRGGDLTIPYKPGEVFQTRRPSGRSLTFNMWAIGADSDGNIPTDATMRSMFEFNFKKLRNLFWNQGKQFTITKRWKDYGSNTVQTASARGVFAGGMAPSMNGALRATFTAEVYLSDPFFYGPEQTITLPTGQNSIVNATILGDYETTAVTILFNGPRNNMRLTNNSEGIYVNSTLDLSTGQTMLIDVNAWTAIKNPGVADTNVIGSITSFGHEFWFVLRPGTQNLASSSGTGNGSVVVKYKPRWV